MKKACFADPLRGFDALKVGAGKKKKGGTKSKK